MGKGWSVRIKISGFTKPHQTLHFPVETIHSFVSFFGLPKISQDLSRSLKISQNISRSWSNGLIIKLFTNVYLFFYPFRFANDSANRHFYWLVVWNIFYFSIFFHILGIIIPTDFHIFQMGWNHQPVYHDWWIGTPPSTRWPRLVCHLSVRWQLRQLRLRILRRRFCAATDPGTWKKTPADWIWRADWNI